MSLWAPPRSGPQLIDATAKPLPPLPSLPSRSPGRRWHQKATAALFCGRVREALLLGATRLGYDRGLRRTGFHQKGKPASRGEDCDDDTFEEHIRPRSGAFTVKFGNSTYGMQTHGDRAHYQIEGLGSGRARRTAGSTAIVAKASPSSILLRPGRRCPRSGIGTGPVRWRHRHFRSGSPPVASHLLWRDI